MVHAATQVSLLVEPTSLFNFSHDEDTREDRFEQSSPPGEPKHGSPVVCIPHWKH